MPLLWHIDDGQHLLAVTAATVDLVDGWCFEGFTTGTAALAAYRVRPPTDLPDVVLMDFFIGSERGDAVTRQLRRLDRHPHGMVIVGHSSVASGSAAIVAAGGTLALPKHRNGQGINPDLVVYLQNWTPPAKAEGTVHGMQDRKTRDP